MYPVFVIGTMEKDINHQEGERNSYKGILKFIRANLSPAELSPPSGHTSRLSRIMVREGRAGQGSGMGMEWVAAAGEAGEGRGVGPRKMCTMDMARADTLRTGQANVWN